VTVILELYEKELKDTKAEPIRHPTVLSVYWVQCYNVSGTLWHAVSVQFVTHGWEILEELGWMELMSTILKT